MFCWSSIFGGLLIMMGQHDRSEALFYYFRLEDQIPEIHQLRLIDKHISFEFVRQQLKDSYSETGRPSIDPELLRILLIGYLYGITSERKLVKELRVSWENPIVGSALFSFPPARHLRAGGLPKVRFWRFCAQNSPLTTNALLIFVENIDAARIICHSPPAPGLFR
jgi:hypothetical protein